MSLTRSSFSWFERISMTIILLNCVTLGMYEPCADSVACVTVRCRILEAFDHAIFVFFAAEMCIKVLAMGLVGKSTYLAETWNCLDMFIVVTGSAGLLFYSRRDSANVSPFYFTISPYGSKGVYSSS